MRPGRRPGPPAAGRPGDAEPPRESPVKSERVFQGRIVNLRVDTVRLPDGRTATREVVEHPGAVCLVALDASENVVLVRQYRRAVDDTLLEVPAGTLHPGESPEACALRELQEETGYTAARLESLATFYTTPGFSSEVMYAYLATGLTPGQQAPDEDEDVRPVRVPLERAVEMVHAGEIRDAKSIATLLLVQAKRRRP